MPRFKRPHRALIAVSGVILAMAAFAAPAHAAPYTNQPTVSVSDQTPAAGSSVKFCGTGFEAGETVTITMDNGTKFPSAVADASGAFCSTLVLGASLSGNHTITALGASSGATASISIQVAGVSADAGTNPSGGLAFTGAAIGGIIALAGLLLVAGGLMLTSSRRRKTSS